MRNESYILLINTSALFNWQSLILIKESLVHKIREDKETFNWETGFGWVVCLVDADVDSDGLRCRSPSARLFFFFVFFIKMTRYVHPFSSRLRHSVLIAHCLLSDLWVCRLLIIWPARPLLSDNLTRGQSSAGPETAPTLDTQHAEYKKKQKKPLFSQHPRGRIAARSPALFSLGATDYIWILVPTTDAEHMMMPNFNICKRNAVRHH